ncbi:TetR/AcrR family transcriptional regulator [Microbacterium excoecariae]|uniref:TetR/AcrR family transcriptional regulator n=1 Tax=Microbacterium excoecariae TaxID=2715210 RepID=UPI0014092FDC|nr:TetR/AcrR family transcriptional regulator [Microbacterium excoecariae]NHI17544.1 TetR/AcrR family transcriptional regulator [Microbacterium excoecariae]
MSAPDFGSPPTDADAPMQRADAQRNRQRILAAARDLYAAGGLGVPMAAIARAAGLGKATVFRHFSTTSELIEAVFTEKMDAYLSATRVALGESDAWQGFVDYITMVCGMQATDRGFADVMITTFPGAESFEERRREAYEGFLAIIERARGTGALRADFVSQDLILVLFANAGVVSATATAAPDAWRRLLAHLIRGFAAPGVDVKLLPPPPDDEALSRAMARAAPLGTRDDMPAHHR